MAKLYCSADNSLLIENLKIADNFVDRAVGLLGRKSLSHSEGLLIRRCNSIHTFFMKFSIDCIFVDKKLKIKKIYTEIVPGRITMPIWGASAVIEVAAGSAQRLGLKVGENLHVVD